MKRILLLFILAYFSIYGDPLITLYLRPFPHANQIAQKLTKPGKIARNTIEGILAFNGVSGIFSTYAGYLEVSDAKGQINFPRKHPKPLLYVVITNKIVPIPMFKNTIHHWEFDSTAPAHMYRVEKKQDEETDLFYWDVQSVALPEDRWVPLESLVIIAKPKNMYLPTGTTLAGPETPNLLLPDMYVKKGINIVGNALYVLNLTHLFGPVHILYKKEAKRYATHVAD